MKGKTAELGQKGDRLIAAYCHVPKCPREKIYTLPCGALDIYIPHDGSSYMATQEQ